MYMIVYVFVKINNFGSSLVELAYWAQTTVDWNLPLWQIMYYFEPGCQL